MYLKFDMVRYNEALDRRSTGRIPKHEDVLLRKFPHGPQQLLEKPSVLVDSGGRIIVWYLPNAITHWIQVRVLIILHSPVLTPPTRPRWNKPQ